MATWETKISSLKKKISCLTFVRRMCLIAALCLTIFHPGYFFPQMQMRDKHTATGEVAMTKLETDTPPTGNV